MKRKYSQLHISILVILLSIIVAIIIFRIERPFRVDVSSDTQIIRYRHSKRTLDISDLQDLQSIDPMKTVYLDLTGRTIHQQYIIGLSNFPNINAICFAGSSIKDDDLLIISNNINLIELNLGVLSITDRGLRALCRSKNLQRLDLAYANCDYETINCLTSLPKLSELRLRGAKVSDSGKIQWRNFSQLRILDVSELKIDNSCLLLLATIPNLISLYIDDNANISGTGLIAIGTWPRLKHLFLDRTALTPSELSEVKRANPNLLIHFERDGSK